MLTLIWRLTASRTVPLLCRPGGVIQDQSGAIRCFAAAITARIDDKGRLKLPTAVQVAGRGAARHRSVPDQLSATSPCESTRCRSGRPSKTVSRRCRARNPLRSKFLDRVSYFGQATGVRHSGAAERPAPAAEAGQSWSATSPSSARWTTSTCGTTTGCGPRSRNEPFTDDDLASARGVRNLMAATRRFAGGGRRVAGRASAGGVYVDATLGLGGHTRGAPRGWCGTRDRASIAIGRPSSRRGRLGRLDGDG